MNRFSIPSSVFAILLIGSLTAIAAEKPVLRVQTGDFASTKESFVLTNGRLEIEVATADGLNPRLLRDAKSGRVYADGKYAWSNSASPVSISKKSQIDEDGSIKIVLLGKLGELEIEQTFFAPAAEPDVLVETIRIHNPSDKPLEISNFACGFTKTVHDGNAYLPDIAQSRFCDVPYRRHPETGELCDFTIQDISEKKWWYSTVRSAIYDRKESTIRGAEGWAWYDHGNSLLISKYNPDDLEWSLVEVTAKSDADGKGKSLRFGGAGRWKLGDPQGAARLEAGKSFTFGETRYQILDGDWREAYAAFHRYTVSKGHRLPKNFDPPVHWNELYDNKLWGGCVPPPGISPTPLQDNAENRKKFYTREDMKIEAEKGRELGCGCLYLDPGWDTDFGSNIWGEDRLGPQKDFVRWIEEEYGMTLALHTPLAPWSDPASYPPEARRMDKEGKRLGELCTSSPTYIETKVARLKELCKNGAYFLMYDGSWFPGECWDKTHGHSLPVTHREHLDAILKIQQKLHEEYPNVLIEQHDPMTGPGTPRYAPTYFLHGKPGAFDELWGFEFMIDPMDDLLSGRAGSLYYLNLAYDIPVYLHTDLRKDNANALVFWWYASTCRHLGLGGKSADQAIWEAQKNAMRTYLSLKRFYAQGKFYGLDENVHCHTLPDLRKSVINCFNLENAEAKKQLRFRLADIGLPPGETKIEGAPFTVQGDEITVEVSIQAKGHLLLQVESVRP
jgi:hypothetical protein